MNIVILYINLNQGGVQRMMVNVANFLCNNGYNVTILLARNEGQYLSMLDSRIRVQSLESNNRFKLISFLVQFLKRNNPDVLFTAVPHFNSIALIARAIAKVKTRIVISERSNTFEEFNKTPISAYKISLLLIPILYRFADSIIAVSKGVALDLSKAALIPLKKVTVIYNPAFNHTMLNEANEEITCSWLTDKTCPVVIGVGRLTDQKDFSSLIKAVQILSKSRPVKLIIIGEGPLRENLEKQIRDGNLSDVVQLVGFQSKPVSWISKADVFALSSKWEGFGNIIVEALAAGTTIVSTDCKSGPSEILENGKYGYLVPVSDPDQLAQQINYAISNPISKYKLIERAKEFDVDIVMKKYESILLNNNLLIEENSY